MNLQSLFHPQFRIYTCRVLLFFFLWHLKPSIPKQLEFIRKKVQREETKQRNRKDKNKESNKGQGKVTKAKEIRQERKKWNRKRNETKNGAKEPKLKRKR